MNTYNNRVRCRMEFNCFKAVLIFILFIFLSIKTSVSDAQSTNPKFYKGLTASFGTRSFRISSDIPEINNLKVLQEGGSAGIIFGNEVLQTRIYAAGLYYSAARVPRTINLFEVEGLVNYYPLRSFYKNRNSKWDPYFVSGVAQDFIKFFGNYLHQQEGLAVNNSTSQEPLLGTIRQTRATIGVGLAWQIVNNASFVKLFAEARYGLPILFSSDNEFRTTTINNTSSINIGVSFGLLQ